MHPAQKKAFYAAMVRIALPIAVLNLFSFGVGTVDSIMLGQLGETAMAAAALGQQVFSIVTSVTFGTTMAAVTIISQYWGRGDHPTIERLIGICLRYTMGACVLAAGVTFLFPSPIMSFFSKDTAVIAAGVSYLRIYAISFLFYGISITLITSLRAVENVRLPMLINVVTYSCNIVLNYLFIFGKLGLPNWGVTGAAVGTLLSRIIETCILLCYFIFTQNGLHLKWRYIFTSHGPLEKTFLKQALPGIITQVAYGFGCTMYPLVFGRLDTGAMAAFSVSFSLNQLFTSGVFGLVNAACVLIGKAIGEGDRKKVFAQANILHGATAVVSVVSGVLLLLLKGPVLGLYAIAPETLVYTDQFLWLTALCILPVGLEGMIASGTLRGGGDAGWNMVSTNLCLWGISIPLLFVGAFVFHLPMWALFLLTKFYFVIKTIWAIVRFLSGKWIKDVTRQGQLTGQEAQL